MIQALFIQGFFYEWLIFRQQKRQDILTQTIK